MKRIVVNERQIVSKLVEMCRKKTLLPKILFPIGYYGKLLDIADDYAFNKGEIELYWNKEDKATITLVAYGDKYYRLQKAVGEGISYTASDGFGTQIILKSNH